MLHAILREKSCRTSPGFGFPPGVRCFPPAHCRGALASQTNSSVIMFEAFYRATMSVRARLRAMRGADTAVAPLPPVSFSTHRFDQRPTSSADFVPSLPHLPSSNSAPACTWPSSSRVLVGEKVRPSPTTLDASAPPRVSPRPPTSRTASAWRGNYRLSPARTRSRRRHPRPPASDSTIKASSSPRRRVALARPPDDPSPRDRAYSDPRVGPKRRRRRGRPRARLPRPLPSRGREPGVRRHVGVAVGKLYKHMSFPEPEE